MSFAVSALGAPNVSEKYPLAPSGFCGDLNKITKAVTSCAHNKVLVQVGAGCLLRFENEVEKAGLEMLLSADAKKQEATLLENEKNMNAARDALTKLVASAEVAYHDTNYYLLNMVQPDELDERAKSKEEQAQIAEAEPCYGPNRRILRGVRRNFKNHFLSLNHAKAMVDGLAGESRLSADRFGSDAPEGQGMVAPLLKKRKA